MKNVLLLLFALILLGCSEEINSDKKSIVGIWGQIESESIGDILEFSSDGKYYRYEVAIGNRYQVSESSSYIVSENLIEIGSELMSFSFLNEYLVISDNSTKKFIRCEKPNLIGEKIEVSFQLYPGGSDSHLNGSLSYKIFTQKRSETDRLGYGGILVVNGFNGLNAYDLSCPVEAERTTRIAPDADGLQAKCPKCGAVYNISSSGAPVLGSQYYLRKYKIENYKVTN